MNRINSHSYISHSVAPPYRAWPIVAMFVAVAFFGTVAASGIETNWPQWRGPQANGAATDADPPIDWGEEENIRWKTPLPGKGHSTPVVWDNQLFLTAAIPSGEALPPRYSGAPGAHDNLPITHRHRFVVLSIDRQTGSILWQVRVHEALPHEGGHVSGSLASASPVTDGERVYAYFGSYGIYCLNFNGDVLWQRQLGIMHSKHGHGEGASPALFGDSLVVNCDHEGESFLAVLNKHTGEPLWRAKREEVTSWSSPVVVVQEDAPQVVVSGTERVRGYRLKTGEVIWECGGLSANISASPVYADGVVYVGSSYEKRALLAIRLAGASGDLTNTDHVLWRTRRGTPYVPSPLLYEGGLFYLSHYQSILTRVVAETGEPAPGPVRLNGLGNIYASPVAAAGRVYVTDLDGATVVVDHAKPTRVLALNRLDDSFSASAALVGREMFLRGEKNLYCIAEDAPR